MHRRLYEIAFMRGDVQALQQQVDWAKANPDGAAEISRVQILGAIFSGRTREAQRLSSEARLAGESSERFSVLSPWQRALFGIPAAPGFNPGLADIEAIGFFENPAQVTKLIDEAKKTSPQNTLLNLVQIPIAKAVLEIRLGNGLKGVELLNTAKPYERASLDVAYTRGLAYLQAGAGPEAAAEFQKIIGNRGAAGLDIVYPLSHLGLARANKMMGDLAKARKSYQDFLALWKDADSDIPILLQANQEYAKLN